MAPDVVIAMFVWKELPSRHANSCEGLVVGSASSKTSKAINTSDAADAGSHMIDHAEDAVFGIAMARPWLKNPGTNVIAVLFGKTGHCGVAVRSLCEP
jgi:hypothetical protein